MDNLFQIDVMAFVSALIGIVVWFVRLEGRIKAQEHASRIIEKEVDSLISKHEALDQKVMEDLSLIRESLARIEGRIFEGLSASKKKV